MNFLNVGKRPEDNAYNQIRTEPAYVIEARVLRKLLRVIRDEGDQLSEKTRTKLEKTLNTGLLDTMNEAREAYEKGVAQIGKEEE